jgi:hypothetical protein
MNTLLVTNCLMVLKNAVLKWRSTCVQSNNDKLSRWPFSLLTWNIVHPVTRKTSCKCSIRAPEDVSFGILVTNSPLFWQNIDVNMLLKASRKCTIMPRPMNKLHLWTSQCLQLWIDSVYILFPIFHSRNFCRRVYFVKFNILRVRCSVNSKDFIFWASYFTCYLLVPSM